VKAFKPGKKGYKEIATPVKAASEEEFQQMVQKGVKNLKIFDDSKKKEDEKKAQPASSTEEEFARKYVTRSNVASESGDVEMQSEPYHETDPEERSQAPYKNVVSDWGGVLVASQNRKDLDTAEGGSMANSAVLFNQYQLAKSMMKPGKRKKLQTVVRNNVAEVTTRPVMEHIKAKAKNEHVACAPGSAEFHALLGTPNGSGVLWMVKDHGKDLGADGIGSIDIDGGNLLVHLA
jgi:hypothetical protein